MNQLIKVTPAFAVFLQTNPWVIVDEDCFVGAYKNRDEARAAKKTHNLAGRVAKSSEFELEIVAPVMVEPEVVAAANAVLADESKTEPVKAEPVVLGPALTDPTEASNQPTEPKTPKAKKTEITNVSTVERPCKKVWDIAENMIGAKRKDVLAACVEAGIAYYTARTQYQQWLGIRKEMAAEAAARDAAKNAAK